MKVFFLAPPQMNVETIFESIPCEPKYFCRSDEAFFSAGHCYPEDLIIYTGATNGIYCRTIQQLKIMKTQCTTVHISTAGGDINWHPLLKQYADENIFDLTVNIDGNSNWPKRPQDLTLIGCVDPKPYEAKNEKTIMLGCNFGSHPERNAFINELNKLAIQGPRTERYGAHASYSSFLSSCRAFININWTKRDEVIPHINMKVLEAGYAGCILLEKKGALTSKYFMPGIDYLEYETPQDVKDICKDLSRYESMPHNLRGKIEAYYSNTSFWSQVLSAVGLK